MQIIYSTALFFAPNFLSSSSSHLQTSFALLSAYQTVFPPSPSIWEGFSQQLHLLICNPKRFSKANQYLRSLPNWINLLWLLCCHWGSSSPCSNGQPFLSLTSLLLVFITELSKYCTRTWFYCTGYCIKKAFPYLKGLPKELFCLGTQVCFSHNKAITLPNTSQVLVQGVGVWKWLLKENTSPQWSMKEVLRCSASQFLQPFLDTTTTFRKHNCLRIGGNLWRQHIFPAHFEAKPYFHIILTNSVTRGRELPMYVLDCRCFRACSVLSLKAVKCFTEKLLF